MSKHSRNNNHGAVFTYHERKRVAKENGTLAERLGKDAQKPFECCWICLNPVASPLASPYGYMYCKRCIYESLLEQKKQIKANMRAYKLQKAAIQLKEANERDIEQAKEVEDFERSQLGLNAKQTKEKAGLKNNFWLPSQTPDARTTKIKKPSKKTIDPMCKKPLRLKELIAVVLTPIDKDDKDKGFKTGIYQCPLSNKTLKNGQKIGLLRPSGNVLLKTCIDKFVIPDGADPITGVKVTEDDIIWLVTAGTGFASKGNAKAKISRPVAWL